MSASTVDNDKRVYPKTDPVASAPSGTNVETIQRKNDTTDVKKIEESTYLFVRGWWMEGEMKVTENFSDQF
jgi:hypothetical protein